MENTFTFYTWLGFRNLILILFFGYWALKLIAFLIQKKIVTKRVNKNVLGFLNKILLLYKPISILLILLGFLAINYIVHGIFLLLISAIGYPFIRNYVGGVLYKINSILAKGVSVTINDKTGEIKKFLPFGIVVNTEKGDSFINYTTIDESGYTVNSKHDTVLRQTLFIKTLLSKSELLDLLFDNPLLNYKEAPVLKELEGSDTLKLQFNLEKGIQAESLIAFLTTHQIETSLTNTAIA
ncbi:hypothetical protein I2486_13725 [Cellulophaga sp. E16_2]|uniref:hypothetical protein n=1 Tax=unclassified Cellulophaga TaxID=2634405 RepID=UPI0013FE0041|nr:MULTISPECIES: hypothetical protein [unclassified Cellulophaga]MBO0592461.1 hypothetical protein [Cellulophaga sp. E16_2]